jgi:hypothetical protein
VILRVGAALALLLGAVALLAYLHMIGKGPFASLEMRHLREMKDRTEAPAATTPWTFDEFAALPHRASVAEYSAIERRGVSIEGYVQRMLRASDGDIHVEIVPAPPPAGELRLYLTGEVTPAFTRGSGAWAYEDLVAALRPNVGGVGPWEGGPRRARFRGWLLYDFQHDDSLGLWSEHAGPPRLTGWEIHPVTGIDLWDDSLARFVEYAR